MNNPVAIFSNIVYSKVLLFAYLKACFCPYPIAQALTPSTCTHKLTSKKEKNAKIFCWWVIINPLLLIGMDKNSIKRFFVSNRNEDKNVEDKRRRVEPVEIKSSLSNLNLQNPPEKNSIINVDTSQSSSKAQEK